MHREVLDYVNRSFHRWKAEPGRPTNALNVLEFGSLDINGSVRSIFQPYVFTYVGVDAQSGHGVDVVADAATFDTDQRFDVVVCTEVFEHTPVWRDIISNSHRLLRDGGLFVATMAGEGRHPHSAIDENPIREWEYYDNVGAWELGRAMKIFSTSSVDVLGWDIRTTGIK